MRDEIVVKKEDLVDLITAHKGGFTVCKYKESNLGPVAGFRVACERRRIFSVTGSAENNVCEPEPENDFCDVTTFVFSLANHIA